MQLDILPALEKGLYPSQSDHQKDIERYFGRSLLRELSPPELRRLGRLDIFFVAFSNRSGSTFLTEIMHQVGFSIPPRAEIFNSDWVIPSCKKNDIPSFTRYFLRIISGWNKNQQVGFKIGARQLFWLTRTGLLSHFRSVKVIHSKRQDRISQAISFYIATQTGQWHSNMEKKDDMGPIPYSRDDILRCLYTIHDGQQLVDYYTDIHNTPTISVDYEDTLADPGREISRLASFLGSPELADVSIDLEAVNIKQQRNEDNERLLNCFRQEFFTNENPMA
ncbi:MAG: hypothetical protein HOC23_18640 [Halieaceae bacterium]|nr:hypothetical protein [Halieaceae bacterium]